MRNNGEEQGKDVLFLPQLFNVILKVLANAKRQEKQIKGITIWKEEIKLSLFTGDMIIYVESLKELTQKLLELINICCKFAHTKLIYRRQSLYYIPAVNKWNLKLKTHYHLY